MNFSEYVEYDENSPSCLVWKIEITSGNGRKMTTTGKPVGHLTKDGYYRFMLNGVKYQCHRIVLKLHGIDCEGYQVDHIDRCKTNNRLSNLRLVDNKENSKNRKMSKANTSGTTGVSLTKEGCRAHYFDDEGKIKTKRFNLKNFKNKEEMFSEAKSWRKNKLKEFGYSEVHGE